MHKQWSRSVSISHSSTFSNSPIRQTKFLKLSNKLSLKTFARILDPPRTDWTNKERLFHKCFSYFLFSFILLPFCMRPEAQRRDNSPFPVSRWTVPAGRRAFEQSKHKGGLNSLTTVRFLGAVEQFRQVGEHLNDLKDKGSWTIWQLSVSWEPLNSSGR